MKTSKIFFISFILFVLCWVIYLFKPFLMTITIGVLMAVSTAGLYAKVVRFCKYRVGLAAFLMTLILSLLFLIPLGYMAVILGVHASNFDMEYFTKIMDYVKNFDLKLPSFLAFAEPKIKEFIETINLGAVAGQIFEYVSIAWKSGTNFIVDFCLIIVFYFFANLYGRDFLKLIHAAIPVEKEHMSYIFSQVANTMSVVLYSTIINAVLQGFLFGIIAACFGFDGLLFGILFAFASLVPVVGGALVYVPMCIYELAIHEKVAAIVILLYSVIFISTLVDNFVKPLIIKFINSKLISSPANISEIMIFFAMIAGISTFGFWGMILGPAIVTLFAATLNSYMRLKEHFNLA